MSHILYFDEETKQYTQISSNHLHPDIISTFGIKPTHKQSQSYGVGTYHTYPSAPPMDKYPDTNQLISFASDDDTIQHTYQGRNAGTQTHLTSFANKNNTKNHKKEVKTVDKQQKGYCMSIYMTLVSFAFATLCFSVLLDMFDCGDNPSVGLSMRNYFYVAGGIITFFNIIQLFFFHSQTAITNLFVTFLYIMCNGLYCVYGGIILSDNNKRCPDVYHVYIAFYVSYIFTILNTFVVSFCNMDKSISEKNLSDEEKNGTYPTPTTTSLLSAHHVSELSK
ncbi:MAG: hypothetical protein Terrestrivirus1_343 [Terrestrivirus sp.]|uniref:Uncharacterized protein n=1 Tax=Terrestrivirus sp. TaxID=2487775 RepID=A0A3G4ZPU7_9VIRU|nr:MAG: hypothetical protein Terrestrivirus1_343 [Terrestrivirus sp.]